MQTGRSLTKICVLPGLCAVVKFYLQGRQMMIKRWGEFFYGTANGQLISSFRVPDLQVSKPADLIDENA